MTGPVMNPPAMRGTVHLRASDESYAGEVYMAVGWVGVEVEPMMSPQRTLLWFPADQVSHLVTEVIVK